MALALYVSISSAVAGVLILGGAFGGGLSEQSSEITKANAARMPLDVAEVFKDKQSSGDARGGSAYFRMDEAFVDDENHCEFCIAMEYKPGPNHKAGVLFSTGKPLDLSEAGKLTFAARGESGGEVVRVYVGGSKGPINSIAKSNAEIPDSAKVNGIAFVEFTEVTLGKEWQSYEIELDGKDISKVTHGFAIEIIGKDDDRKVIYLDHIFYDSAN